MWTLEEALRRTLSFADAQELGPLRRRLHSDLTDEDTRQDVGEALDAIHASFCVVMAAGRLVAFGQREGGNGEMVAIPAGAWRRAVIDWDASALSYGRRADRVGMVSVRVRPLLHIPGAPAMPAALALSVAFRTFVLDDPALVAILDRANGCFPGAYACMCNGVSSGLFTDETPLWPAAIEEHDLAVEWMDAFRGRFADRPPAARRGALDHLAARSSEDRAALRVIREAEAVVLDRVTRFLEPLRSGAIVASGTEDGFIGQSFVPREVWSRPTARIDFIRSELLTIKGGPPERVWSGLVLSRPETSRASPVAPEPTRKAKRGPRFIYYWPGALERLDRRVQTEGDPMDRPHCVRMVIECFEAMKSKVPDESLIRKRIEEMRPDLWRRIA